LVCPSWVPKCRAISSARYLDASPEKNLMGELGLMNAGFYGRFTGSKGKKRCTKTGIVYLKKNDIPL
jgi:hypothetical protein